MAATDRRARILMRIEFLELLRCPGDHVEAPLVTVATRRDGLALRDATVGCPECGATYALQDGELALPVVGAAGAAPAVREVGRAADREVGIRPDATLRLAAMLALEHPGIPVLLAGAVATLAPALEASTGALCLQLQAQGSAPRRAPTDRLASRLRLDAPAAGTPPLEPPREPPREPPQLPLATAALRGAAFDAAHAAWVPDAARVVAPGGRVVAPVAVPVPQGLRELTRDATEWVAEARPPVERSLPLAQLVRRRP